MNKDSVEFVKIKEDEENRLKKILFASYLREDYVDKAFTLFVNPLYELEKIYFSSNAYGTVYWKNGIGLNQCHTWEDEATAENHSFLTKNYTTVCANGEAKTEYAKETIIPDVIKNIANEEMRNFIEEVIHKQEHGEPLELQKFIPEDEMK